MLVGAVLVVVTCGLRLSASLLKFRLLHVGLSKRLASIFIFIIVELRMTSRAFLYIILRINLILFLQVSLLRIVSKIMIARDRSAPKEAISVGYLQASLVVSV